MNDVLFGWISVVIASVAFGSFGVPIKSKRVLEAKVHPLAYQSYKTFWVLVSCWISLLLTDGEWHYTPWGIVSGLFWIPGGISAIVSITYAGLAVGQGIWSSFIVIISFIWGTLIFQEKLKSVWISLIGVGLLILGVFGMAIFSKKSTKNQNLEKNSKNSQDSEYLINQDKNNDKTMKKDYFETPCGKIKHRFVGILAALFTGIYGGSVMAPLKIAKELEGSEVSGIDYVISFAIGAAIVNVFLWIIMIIFCLIKKQKIPSLQIKIMAIPGSISGILWSIGNFFSIYAVIYLGEAIGYSSVQASIVVSGLWGIFWYRECTGKNVFFWLFSAILAIGGIVVLSKMRD